MRKLEKIIRKNLDLKIPMRYSESIKRVSVWKYCVPVVAIFLLGFFLYQPNKKIPNVPILEDSIVINQVHSNSTLDRADSQLKYMYEIIARKDLTSKPPFIHRWLKDWTLEHYFNRFILTYHKNQKIVSVSIVKDRDIVQYERNLQVSMIEEVPVEILYNGDYYRASFMHGDYFYSIISRGIEESSFTQLLKQMIHYLQTKESMAG